MSLRQTGTIDMNNRESLQHRIFQEYKTSLDALVGEEGRYLQVKAEEQTPFWIVAYDSVPQYGSVTAFTFGISSIPHTSWKFGVPELVISIDSSDENWLSSLGALACSIRGKCPFSLGNVLRFGLPLSVESVMSAYFLFWPTILEKDQQRLKIADRTINFIQAYPIYESEVDIIAKIGSERFFMLDGVDFSDISRQPVTAG